MKCFVTGGAGFIGSHLVDRLLNEKHEVTVFDDMSSGKEEFIAHHFNNPNFNFIKEDLINKTQVEKEIKDHDVVFHIAANPDVRSGADNPSIAEKDIQATYNLLDAMRMQNIKKIVFSSSSVIYGEMCRWNHAWIQPFRSRNQCLQPWSQLNNGCDKNRRTCQKRTWS